MTFRIKVSCWAAVLSWFACSALADTFDAGENRFSIEFVTISGSSNPVSTSGEAVVTHDYRIGKFEITNDQWSKFKASLGVPVTGDPSVAYDSDSRWTDPQLPANRISWYEAAQFVNWLNTSTGHPAAYKFTGTQGTANYRFDVWSSEEACDGRNFYRHKDAFYYLPTEDEWLKAAFWNGTNLQTWATVDDSEPVAGVASMYGQALPLTGPWAVGTGARELNGTFDMMGNIKEWTESPLGGDYGAHAWVYAIGGDYGGSSLSASRNYTSSATWPYNESSNLGFRVAANTPEPGGMLLFSLGGLTLLRRKRGW